MKDRRGVLRLTSSVISLVALVIPFLPYFRVSFDEYSLDVSGYMALISKIRINDEQLVEFPVGIRIAIVLSLIAVASGVFANFRKKQIIAAGALFLGFGSAVTVAAFLANIRTELLSAGCSTAEGSVGVGWFMFLFLTLSAAVLSLLVSGIEKSAETVFQLTAFISVGAVVIITAYMFASGLPAIAKIGVSDFLFGAKWAPVSEDPQFGIINMILATILGCAGAIVIGVPIGLLTAVFLSEIAPEGLSRVMRPAVELLAGIPSVIYGFWGMKVLVPFIREFFTGIGYNSTGSGLGAVIIILAVMILPTIIRVAETALRSVPISYTEAALALGNTKVSTIFSVQIPAARSGILAGVILGVGRAIGETMAVIMVAGNIVQFPTLFSSVRPMTAGIAFEMGYAEAGLHRQALFAIGLVLFVFIMIVNISFSYISGKGVKANGR